MVFDGEVNDIMNFEKNIRVTTMMICIDCLYVRSFILEK